MRTAAAFAEEREPEGLDRTHERVVPVNPSSPERLDRQLGQAALVAGVDEAAS
jgi:hypothetical protein